MRTPPVDALDSIGSISATVRVANLWRLKLGCWLLRLAGLVLRCPVGVHPAHVQGSEADGQP